MGTCHSCGENFDEYKSFCPSCSSGAVSNNESLKQTVPLTESEIEKYKAYELFAFSIPIFSVALSVGAFSILWLYSLLIVFAILVLGSSTGIGLIVTSYSKQSKISPIGIMGMFLNASTLAFLFVLLATNK